MLNVINNYKLRIFTIIFIGFIIISTITAISIYSMYQYHFSNAYKDANRIIRLYERSYSDIQKDLEYLKLIDFSKKEEEIQKNFKTISKIIYDKNKLVNGIVLIKQFREKELKKEENILQNILHDTNIKIRPIQNYLYSMNKNDKTDNLHAIIYHREPSIVKKDIRGVDVMSEESRHESISKMNFSEHIYMTKPLEIVNGSNGYTNSIILYYPLFKENSKDNYYKWLLAVPITLQNVLDKLKIKHPFIDNYIVKIYDYDFSKKDLLCEGNKKCQDNYIELSKNTFNFASRDTTIVVGMSNIYTLENFWQPLLGFSSGMVFLVLIGYYLFYREKKEKQVRELETQIQKAREISKIGHFTWNNSTKKFTCSDEIVEMFNVNKNTFTFEEVESKYYKNDYHKANELLNNLVTKSIDPEGEFEYRILVEGNIKWLLTKYNAIYTKDGTLIDVFGVTQDITEFKNKESFLRKQSQEFKKLAIIDNLTNIYNRAHFDKQLENHLEQFIRYDKVFSIILFDIDHFKSINDNYGHDMGDFVLKEISKIATNAIRKSDVIARWGGEEFIILLPNISNEQAEVVALKLKNVISKHTFSEKFSITCSFGVTEVLKDDNPKSLFKRVDVLLYEAKGAGRNMVIRG